MSHVATRKCGRGTRSWAREDHRPRRLLCRDRSMPSRRCRTCPMSLSLSVSNSRPLSFLCLGRAPAHKFVCTTALGQVQPRPRILSRVRFPATLWPAESQSMPFKIIDESPRAHAKGKMYFYFLPFFKFPREKKKNAALLRFSSTSVE